MSPSLCAPSAPAAIKTRMAAMAVLGMLSSKRDIQKPFDIQSAEEAQNIPAAAGKTPPDSIPGVWRCRTPHGME